MPAVIICYFSIQCMAMKITSGHEWNTLRREIRGIDHPVVATVTSVLVLSTIFI